MGIANLGELERLEGRLDRARPLLERALAIYDKQIANGSIAASESASSPILSLRWGSSTKPRVASPRQSIISVAPTTSFSVSLASPHPTEDYARVLRKAGRIAEAEKIEASLNAVSTK